MASTIATAGCRASTTHASGRRRPHEGPIDRRRSTARHHQSRGIHAMGPAEQRVRHIVRVQHFTGQRAQHTKSHDLGCSARVLQRALLRRHALEVLA